MNLKRVRKRDLCSLIRFLNFYYLSQNRIHYFSIRVKDELVKDLAKLYQIRDHGTRITFTSNTPPVPNFCFEGNQWFMEGSKITLPRSRKECVRAVRRLHISRKQVTLIF